MAIVADKRLTALLHPQRSGIASSPILRSSAHLLLAHSYVRLLLSVYSVLGPDQDPLRRLCLVSLMSEHVGDPMLRWQTLSIFLPPLFRPFFSFDLFHSLGQRHRNAEDLLKVSSPGGSWQPHDPILFHACCFPDVLG